MAKVRILWPDLPLPIQPSDIPQAEINAQMPGNGLAGGEQELKHAAEIRSLGVSPEALLKKEKVRTVIQRLQQTPYTEGSPASFLALARLGIVPLQDLFPDRDAAWKVALEYLEQFRNKSSTLKLVLPAVAAELRLLFPEHEDDILVSSKETTFALTEVQAMQPNDISALLGSVVGLYLMTAERLELGSNGEFIVHRKPTLPGSTPRQLPARDLT